MARMDRRQWTTLPVGGAECGSWSVRQPIASRPDWVLFFLNKPMLRADGTPLGFKTVDAAQRWLERRGGGAFLNGGPRERPCEYCGQMVDWGSTTPYELPDKAVHHSSERCRSFLAARVDRLADALQAVASWGAVVDDEPESRKIARDVLHEVGRAAPGYKPKQWNARRRREQRQREGTP